MKKIISKLICIGCFAFLILSHGAFNHVINVIGQVSENEHMYYANEKEMFVNEVEDARNVQLLEKGEFFEGKRLNKEYIMSYSAERILANFKITSQIPTSYKEYGGWAQRSVGAGSGEVELLSAYCYLYAEEKDPLVLERINQFVDIIYECQEKYAELDPENAGYVSAFDITQLDTLEKYNDVFWPIFYSFAKNLEAYYDAYYYAHNEKALQIWLKLGRYLANRVAKYDYETHRRVLIRETGDISICFFQLYMFTKEEIFKQAAFNIVDEEIFEKLLNNEDPFEYVHCNRSIPVVRAAILAYLATKDQKYLTIARNGFSIMVDHRAYANGNTSETEDLHPHYETVTTGFQNCETCCAYNYMKVCDMLYRITNDKYYMDYYENLLYNQILSSIDWDTGMKTYYISMDSGYYKAYHDVENSFWCCTCTGWESFAKFNQNIYYTNNNSLIVNLFINSEVNDSVTGLGLKQLHNYPNENVVRFEITKSANTTLKIRQPSWISGETLMSYNGEMIDVNVGNDGYIVLNRNFEKGDIINIKFPMSFRFSRLDSKVQPHKDAIMYGPIMMVGVIESIGEISPIVTNSHIGKSYDNKIKDDLFYETESIFDNVSKVDDLKYVIHAKNQDVLIEAFFKCYREKYIVYWDCYKIDSEEYDNFMAESSKNQTKIIDNVNVGDYFSETPHNYQTNNKTWIGNYATEKNRGLVLDGYFSYDMKLEKGVQNILAIKHFGTDDNYSYNIYFNNNLTYTASVSYIGKKFYWKEFEIPLSYSQNKDKVNVKIECCKGTLTTGIYQMETRREDLPLYQSLSLNLSANQEQEINLDNYLLDNVVFAGTGSIEIRDGNNNLIYKGDATNQISKYQQYQRVKIKALEDSNLNISFYGARVTSVNPIEYSVAADDMYYPLQYATVNLENNGTVRLRLAWDQVVLTKGTQSGQVPIYNTNLYADYNITNKRLNNGLILHYSFENVENNIVHDSSNNHLDATIVGDANIVEGKYGKGLDLQGASYLSLPSLPSLDKEMTLSINVKYNSTNKALFQRLFDLGNDLDNYLTLTSSGYACGKNNGKANNVNQLIYTIKEDVWYNVSMTIKDNVAITFVNGVEVSRNEQFSYNLSSISSYLSNYIGKSHVEFTPLLNGVIDDVRIYNYALSKDQIAGLAKIKDSNQTMFASNDIAYEEIEEKDIDITKLDTKEKQISFDDEDIAKPEEKSNKKGCKSSLYPSASILALAVLLKKKKGGKK